MRVRVVISNFISFFFLLKNAAFNLINNWEIFFCGFSFILTKHSMVLQSIFPINKLSLELQIVGHTTKYCIKNHVKNI